MTALIAACVLAAALQAAQPAFESQLIFPLEHWHNHSSSIVELGNGDLFVCWYNGSGERKADDVKIEACRLKKGTQTWGTRFTLADTPHFPDCNPILFVDSTQRLWLVWPVILANQWETALTQYRISSTGWKQDPPKWDISESLLFIPRNFEARVKQFAEPLLRRTDLSDRERQELKQIADKAGDKYFSRMGWMPRTHPLELPSGRILVPLYSDGYNFSLIAITDDRGKSWSTSEPLPSAGGVQPSLVRRKDGAIVAYMRDNGPPPQRVQSSVSKDDGITWSEVVDTEIPNSGTSVEAIALKEGRWLMVNNDTERGRHSLLVSVSDDEGRTWKWNRHLEVDRRPTRASSFHYPSVIQSRDGMIHVTYSYFLNHLAEGQPRKSIKYVRFNVEWVREGDPRGN